MGDTVMIGWLVVAVFTVSFAVVMGGLLRTTMRPLDETDQWCAWVDQEVDALEARNGGWRN